MDRRTQLEHAIMHARAVLQADERGDHEIGAEEILWCTLKHALGVEAHTTARPGPRPTGNRSSLMTDDPVSSTDIACSVTFLHEAQKTLVPANAEAMCRRNWIVLQWLATGRSMRRVANDTTALHQKLNMPEDKLSRQRVGQIKWETLAELAIRLRSRFNLADFLLRAEIVAQSVKRDRNRKKPRKTGRILHPISSRLDKGALSDQKGA